ncbi:MAG: glutaredoxin family protein [Thermoleophilaceae bacterium]|nr:glutaredoxin family protein [Thermoleophilaceae bacterium]
MDRALLLLIIVVVVCVFSAFARAAIRRRHHIEQFEVGDFAPGTQVIVFTSPYCHGCRQWLDALEEDTMRVEAIDIAERPQAAARYRINSTPRVAVIDDSGSVLREFSHYEPRRSDLDQIIRLTRAA